MKKLLGNDAYEAARKKTREKLRLYREVVYEIVEKVYKKT